MPSTYELDELQLPDRPAGRFRRGPAERSRLAVVLWLTVSVPVIALVGLFSLAIRVRFGEGAWPSPNNPNPTEYGVHYLITGLAIVASIPAMLIAPAISFAAFLRGHERWLLSPVVAGFVSLLVLLVLIRADIAGLGSWILD